MQGDRCTGCGRTLTEIAGWGTATDADRQAVLDRIAAQGRSDTAD